MHENISLDVLTNWVSMLRADVDGAVWLADDTVQARFYEKIAHQSSRIVPAQNVALPLLDAVEQRGVQGVVAAVTGVATAEDAHNIFRPAQGDVLLLLFMSAESPRVMLDICGGDWVSACDKDLGSIRHRLMHLASAFGRIRIACDLKNTPFEAEQLHEFVDWTAFEIDWRRVDALAGVELIGPIRAACNNDLVCDTATLARQCLGVDVIHLFGAATRLYRPRGIEPRGSIDSNGFMGMLRVAFDPSEIEGDELFWKMKKWIRLNPKYPLLRGWRDLDPLGII